LDYFPCGAFTNRFEYIRNMYLGNIENVKRDFIYLSKSEMNEFVDKASFNIMRILDEKLLLMEYSCRD
jgi:hypothetical protein